MKIFTFILLPIAALAQARLTATFSDPNRPGTVRISATEGSVEVVGGPGKEVLVETVSGSRREREAAGGMRRIIVSGGGLEIQEENNVMRINAEDSSHPHNLRVTVPMKTSLIIKCVNRGATVEGVEGEVDVSSTNGNVIVRNVSGSVIASSDNGKIEVMMTAVAPGKPMSFVTMNGNVDVTLPATTKANLRMRTEHGDVFTDFDVNIRGDQTETKTTTRGTRRGWKSDSFTLGTINGGGPEIRLESMNGRIYIRKKQ